MRVGILTVSDGCARGEREDVSGALIRSWCDERGAECVVQSVVPDDRVRIVQTLTSWADGGTVDVLLTTGGTGLTRRDVTPEATRAVLEREAPGIAEVIRRVGGTNTPFAALSRGLAGTRGSTLIVNLPGSTGGVRDGLAVLDGILDHAVALITGENTEHGAAS